MKPTHRFLLACLVALFCVTLFVPPACAAGTSTVVNGNVVTLTVTYTPATATPPISFQWKKDGTAIPNATASQYVRTIAAPTDAGNYTCTVSNVAGSVESDTVVVTFAIGPTGAIVTATVK